jgi:hypothetical protein
MPRDQKNVERDRRIGAKGPENRDKNLCFWNSPALSLTALAENAKQFAPKGEQQP